MEKTTPLLPFLINYLLLSSTSLPQSGKKNHSILNSNPSFFTLKVIQQKIAHKRVESLPYKGFPTHLLYMLLSFAANKLILILTPRMCLACNLQSILSLMFNFYIFPINLSFNIAAHSLTHRCKNKTLSERVPIP